MSFTEATTRVEKLEQFTDDVHGGRPDPKMVRAPRSQEVRWRKTHGTCRTVFEAETQEQHNVSVIWVFTNKGDAEHPDC